MSENKDREQEIVKTRGEICNIIVREILEILIKHDARINEVSPIFDCVQNAAGRSLVNPTE